MNTQPITLRQARPDDAITLAALAIQVFLDTYATQGVRADLAKEALSVYTPQEFATRMEMPNRYFVMAEQAQGLLGFAELDCHSLPAPAGRVDGAELIRLYLQPRAQGRGLGRQLIRAAEQLAQAQACVALWLTAWEGNYRALAFYAHMGYQDIGQTSYILQGESYANRVLSRRLDVAGRCALFRLL